MLSRSPTPSTAQTRLAFAFLLVSAGVGCCIYGAMLWRELPTYTEAEIEASAELNLAIDLQREGQNGAGHLSPTELDARRMTSLSEVRSEIETDRDQVRAWLLGGVVLILLGGFRAWSAHIGSRFRQ